MAEINVQDLQWLLNVGEERGRAQARRLRGDNNPEWADDFFVSLARHTGAPEDPTINKTNGMRHTVESMVSELRNRVQLDAINKEGEQVPFDGALGKDALLSAASMPPLSYKKADDNQHLLESMKDYILRHHVMPSRGQTPPEALYEVLKDQFGIESVHRVGGREKLMDMLSKLRDDNRTPSAAEGLPTYDGSPMAVRYDYDPKDRALFMTRDTGGSPGSYM